MIAIHFDSRISRFRVFGPAIDILVPAGADPEGFALMARNAVHEETGVSLPVVRF